MWSSNLDLYAQSASRKTLHYPCSFSQKSQYLKILIPLSNDLITIYRCISNRLDYHCSLVSGLCSYLWGVGGGGGERREELSCLHLQPSLSGRQSAGLAWYFKFLAFINSISYTCFLFCRLCPSHPWCSSKCWSRVSLSIGWHCMYFFNIFHYISSLQLLFGLVATCPQGGCVLHDKYKAICCGLYCTLLHLLVVLCPLWSNER